MGKICKFGRNDSTDQQKRAIRKTSRDARLDAEMSSASW